MSTVNSVPADAAGAAFYERGLRAFSKIVLIMIRQSTHAQFTQHLGSRAVQHDQRRYLEPFNVPDERIITIEPAGESASGLKERPSFDQALRLVDSGDVGVIATARHDRLYRNGADHERLMDAAKRQGVLVMIAGRLYDPTDEHDELLLGVHAHMAQFENRQRIRWLLLARFALAQRCQYRLPLPTPFCWASPQDPEYVAAMRRENLYEEWVHPLVTTPDAYLARSMRDRRTYYPLPYPDRAALRACEHILQLVIETGSVGEALRRSRRGPHGPADPRDDVTYHGRLPVLRSRYFDPRETMVWKRLSPTAVRRWLDSPGLWGRYDYVAKQFAGKDPAARVRYTVCQPDAFRGLGTPDLGEEDPRHYRSGVHACTARGAGTEGACPAGGLLRDRSSGRRAMPTPPPRDGDRALRRSRVRAVPRFRLSRWGEALQSPSGIEALAFDVITEEFSPTVLQAELARYRFRADDARKQRLSLESERDRVASRAEAATDKELDAHRARLGDEELLWADRRRALEVRRQQLTAAIDTLERDYDRLRAATAAEVEAILQLARDLPHLLQCVRPYPDLARQLVRACIAAVHVRKLAWRTFLVEVEFPTGVRKSRVLFERPGDADLPSVRAYAAARCGQGVSSATVAVELRTLAPYDLARANITGDVVDGLVYRHVLGDSLTAPPKTAVSVVEVAQRVRVPIVRVLTAVLKGDLGRVWAGATPALDGKTLAIGRSGATHPDAWVDCGACVFVDPTPQQLARQFPTYERELVATATGWPIEDTMTVAEVGAEYGEKLTTIVQRARRLGPLAVEKGIAGRRFVRASLTGSATARRAWKRALQAAADRDPHLNSLAAGYWRALPSVKARAVTARVMQSLPHVPVPSPRGAPLVMVWMGPETYDVLGHRALEAVVHDKYGPGASAELFLPVRAASTLLRGAMPSHDLRGRIREALGRGTIRWARAVWYSRSHGIMRRYIEAPAWVRSRATAAAVLDWLEGRSASSAASSSSTST